jgi:hypothetical protein
MRKGQERAQLGQGRGEGKGAGGSNHTTYAQRINSKTEEGHIGPSLSAPQGLRIRERTC